MHIIPDLPSEWSPQPNGKVLHLESVPSASPEYTQATKRFLETLEGAKCTIVSVKRIQNPGEYLKYMGLKASFEQTSHVYTRYSCILHDSFLRSTYKFIHV